MYSTATAPPPADTAALSPRLIRLREKAEELEASFISEMLAHSGLGAQQGSFSGGLGEEQFASFLRNEQARLMAASGGFGLAETIFHALAKSEVTA